METSPSPSTSTSSQAGEEFGPDFGGRVKGLTIVKPIVIGSIATPFPKKRESDGHTHNWMVYVKPYRNEDYSSFIKKIQFKLHDSYEDPKRIVSGIPFTVAETGWGEFEIPIKIFFMDPTERPVTVHHALKLFDNNDDTSQDSDSENSRNPIVSESYDEIVFQDPTRYMKSLLENLKPFQEGPYTHYTDFEAEMSASMAKINAAKLLVRAEIEELRSKLMLSKETVEKFSNKLDEAKGKKLPEKAKKKKTKSGPKTLAKSLSSMKLNPNKN